MPPPGPTGLEDLPEPAALHARFSANGPVNWGDQLPSKKEIAAEFGDRAAVLSLTMISRAAAVEAQVTEDLLAAVRLGTVSYQLEHRVKSPQSLARKIHKLARTQFAEEPLDDVLRYTMVAREAEDLVETAVNACERLTAKGWVMDSVHHSYVDGSRYKGLHMFLRSRGELIELQIHSRESIDVKVRTTPLYVVERDSRQDRESRDVARAECIAISGQMTQPAGIDQLTTLGGVAVSTRSYGTRGKPVQRANGEEPSQAQGPAPHQRSNSNHKDGISK
jgi:hypothetical protein